MIYKGSKMNAVNIYAVYMYMYSYYRKSVIQKSTYNGHMTCCHT